MPSPALIKAIAYANYHYYSKPMKVINLNSVQIPISTPLTELRTPQNHVLRIRSSHGFLHAISAMELQDKIYEKYAQHVLDFDKSVANIADYFKINTVQLRELINLAVFFHDSAREGDGIDLWDRQSAEACRKFLIKKWRISKELAEFISDTIRFKDEEESFKEKYKNILNADFMRQLVNMGDTLEVIRTREEFKPEFMPIAKLVTPEVMINDIIPNLVVPHRQYIIDQGRLKKAGRIIYSGYDDSQYVPNPGANYEKMTAAYLQKSEEYCLSILEISTENIDLVIERALRGIKNYKEEYSTSRIQLFHNGFFSPRFHGERGQSRAGYYESLLDKTYSLSQKVNALVALFASKDGATLKDEVLRSFNQVNRQMVIAQLNELAKKLSSGFPAEDYSVGKGIF